MGEDALRIKTLNSEGKSDLSFTEVINGILNRYTTKYFHAKDDTHPCEEFLDDRDLKMFNVVRHLTLLTDDQLVALANIARGYVIGNHVKEEKGADHKVLGIGK